MSKKYLIKIDEIIIGSTDLEKADAPMGVAFGLIDFNRIDSPYTFFKEYLNKNGIAINIDDL